MKHFLLFLLWLCLFIPSAAADPPATIEFAQEQMNYGPGAELSNVLKVQNHTHRRLQLRPRLILPEGWSLVFALPETLTLEPGADPLYLPVDILVGEETVGGARYRLVARIHDAADRYVYHSHAEVRIEEMSDWSLELEQSEVFLPVRSRKASVGMRIRNDGNRRENLRLELSPHRNLLFPEEDKYIFTLAPGQDSLLRIPLLYLPSQPAPEQIPLRIDLQPWPEGRRETRRVLIHLLREEFNHLASHRPNNRVEALLSRDPQTGELQYGGQAAGTLPLGGGHRLEYQWAQPDVTNARDLVYNLRYEGRRERLEFRQRGLRGEYRREWSRLKGWALRADHRYATGATQLRLTGRTSWDDRRLNGGLSAFWSPRSGQALISGFGAAHLPLGRQHQWFVQVGGSRAAGRGETPWTQYAGQFFLRYLGDYGPRWRLLVEQDYQSASVGGQPGRWAPRLELLYQPLDRRHRLALEYEGRWEEDQVFRNGRRQDAPGMRLHQLSTSWLFAFLSHSQIHLLANARRAERAGLGGEQQWGGQMTWKQGRALQVQWSHMEGVFLDQNRQGENWSRDILLAQYRRGDLQASYRYRFRRLWSQELLPQRETDHRLSIIYRKSYYSLGLRWLRDGRGDYLTLPLQATGRMWQRRLGFRLGVNALWTPLGMRISGHSEIEWSLGTGWELVFRGRLTGEVLELPEGPAAPAELRTDQLQFGLRKSFVAADLGQGRAQLRVRCFKDKNGNNRYDEGEPPMPEVRLHLSPVADSSGAAGISLRHAAVFTGPAGEGRFSHLPKGVYQLLVHQLFPDEEGYFHNSSESLRLDLQGREEVWLPFGKGKIISGRVELKRDPFSSYEDLPLRGIRINAESADGRQFSALTDRQGRFSLVVTYSPSYRVSMNNPYGGDFQLAEPAKVVKLDEGEPEFLRFVIEEQSVEVEWN